MLVSQILLWIAVIVLGALVAALARQVGILHERIAPAGALTLHQGVNVGDAVKPMQFTTLDGSGLGIGGIGASRVVASGRVYGLTERNDLAGPYVQLKEGWAVGRAGQGRVWLKNDKGVTISLDTRRQGLQATIGADGVVIAFK